MRASRTRKGAQDQVLAFASILCVISSVSAGHFKYATLSWQEVVDPGAQPNTVRFTLLSSWSTDYAPYKSQGTGGAVSVNDTIRIQGLGNPVLEFGDGGSQLLKAKVISVDLVRQSWLGVSSVDHTYSSRSTWHAVFSGCCRGTYLQNNAGEYWNVTSTVNLNQNTITVWEGWAFSPQTAILPRVTVRASRNISVYIPATTPGMASVQMPSGRQLLWALCAPADYGSPAAVPINAQANISASLDAATGKLTVLAAPGIYSACAVITDLGLGAAVTVDFELEALPAPAAAAAPAWDLQFPAAPAPVRAYRPLYIGYRDQFVLRFNETGPASPLPDGSAAPASPATGRPAITSGLLPAGMSVGPLTVNTFPRGAPGGVRGLEATVSWAPAAGQRNESAACFGAAGNNSAYPAPPLCVAFDVEPDPPPEWVGNGSCADAPAGTACFPNATFLVAPPPILGKQVPPRPRRRRRRRPQPPPPRPCAAWPRAPPSPPRTFLRPPVRFARRGRGRGRGRQVTVVLTARDPNPNENLTIAGVSLPADGSPSPSPFFPFPLSPSSASLPFCVPPSFPLSLSSSLPLFLSHALSPNLSESLSFLPPPPGSPSASALP